MKKSYKLQSIILNISKACSISNKPTVRLSIPNWLAQATLTEQLKKEESKRAEAEQASKQLRETMQDMLKKIKSPGIETQDVIDELRRALGDFRETLSEEISYLPC